MGERMPAISLHAPYGQLIISGRKWIECRSKPTKHRGDLGVHLTKNGIAPPGDPVWSAFAEVDGWAVDLGPPGHVIGVVSLVDCVPMKIGRESLLSGVLVLDNTPTLYRPGRHWQTVADQEIVGDFREGMYAYVLEAPRALSQPLQCSGAQAVWRLSEPITTAVREQL